MINNITGIREMEATSSLSMSELMEEAGKQLAHVVRKYFSNTNKVLILAGKGNNGGDAFVLARLLEEYTCNVFLVDGKPQTEIAFAAYQKLNKNIFIIKRNINRYIEEADIIIDGVYGIGFHGTLPSQISQLFSKINTLNKTVISIDINSGVNGDTGQFDSNTIHSTYTFALGCYKPFHMLRKDHQLFQFTECLPLPINYDTPTQYFEMNEEIFFQNFPKKPENAYKGIYGKTLLISGCWGMAGAACLNIIGAQTVGASYINASIPQEIYELTASHFLTPVFHPFGDHSWYEVLEPLISDARAIGFGSGAVYMPHKSDILDLLLQNSSVPVVLDAEALRLLKQNTYILRFAKAPVILTPHIGEFAYFTGKPIEVIMDDKINIAKQFAKEYRCIIVLKGPHTIVVSPSGSTYINQSGNQALVQAGSGDVLTGIMTAILSMTSDVYTAVCMAVWIHGKLVELGTQNHSIQGFKLERFPELMDAFFAQHGL